MNRPRTGGARCVRGRFFARVRTGDGKRANIPLPTCTTQEAADARAIIVGQVADQLIKVGRRADAVELAKAMGTAKDAKTMRVLKLAAAHLVATASPAIDRRETFAAFAARWTRGDLARAYPDRVRSKKQPEKDSGILEKIVNPIIGHLAVADVTQDHADRVLLLSGARPGSAWRRHVAQVVYRVLRLAAFPAKLIPVSPLPPLWLPKITEKKAKTYLYPDEDKKLLARKEVPVVLRLLWGFLAREGMRPSEALALDWSDVDVERGAVNLDENKTDDPRAWALDPGVVAALRWWKPFSPVGPFQSVVRRNASGSFRGSVLASGADRSTLHKTSDKRRPIRQHDLRATFVTNSLANGKTETWVQDRTGHRSSDMIGRYRRIARTVAELNLGPLAPLNEAIPECLNGDQMGQQNRPKPGRVKGKK